MKFSARGIRLPLILAGFGLVAVPSASEAAALERIELDTRKAGKMRIVQSRTVLEAGRSYVLKVRGTYSEYSVPTWTRRQYCGNPEFRPLYKSAGMRNGRVGADPEFTFALPTGKLVRPNGQDCAAVSAAPQRVGDFQVNTGVVVSRPGVVARRKWHHPSLLRAGAPRYSKRHTYRYLVQGAGKRIKLRVHDNAPSDNYGVLRIALYRGPAAAPAPTSSDHVSAPTS